MYELLLCGGAPPPLPQINIFNRLADIAVAVNAGLAVINTPIENLIYLEGGKNFHNYNIETGLLLNGTVLRNKNLAYSQGTILADPAARKFYQLGSTAGGVYQPDSLWSPMEFSAANNAWTSTNVPGGSAATDFYGYGTVAAKNGNIITQCGGFLQNGSYQTKAWNINVTAKTYTSFVSAFSTGPTNMPTAGSNIGTALYVLNRDGKIRRLTMGVSNGWAGTVYYGCPVTPGIGVRAITYGNKIYFYGGGLGDRLFSFDPAGYGGDGGEGLWEQVARGGPGGSYPGLCLSGSLLWIFSGKEVWTAELDPSKWDPI